MAIHTFQSKLEQSKKHNEWFTVKLKNFYGADAEVIWPEDKGKDDKGVDCIVKLASGHTINVDVKALFRDVWDRAGQQYVIPIEFQSSVGRPGWTTKTTSSTDVVAFGFLDRDTVIMIPFHSLQRAWLTYQSVWFEKADAKEQGFWRFGGENPTYTSRCLAVPYATVARCIAELSVI